MSIEQTIVCDTCGGIIAAHRSLQHAKADARSTGAYVPEKGSAAVCHHCRGMFPAQGAGAEEAEGRG